MARVPGVTKQRQQQVAEKIVTPLFTIIESGVSMKLEIADAFKKFVLKNLIEAAKVNKDALSQNYRDLAQDWLTSSTKSIWQEKKPTLSMTKQLPLPEGEGFDDVLVHEHICLFVLGLLTNYLEQFKLGAFKIFGFRDLMEALELPLEGPNKNFYDKFTNKMSSCYETNEVSVEPDEKKLDGDDGQDDQDQVREFGGGTQGQPKDPFSDVD